jgi:Domain of unknown function (DUF6134)
MGLCAGRASRLRRWGLRCVLAAATLLAVASMTAAPGAAAGQTLPRDLQFDVVRDGEVIGHHKITFRPDGDRLIAHSELAIKVDSLLVTLYRYEQTRDEVWRAGRLVAFAAKTDDDGARYDVKGEAGPDGIRVTSGRESWTLPADSLPASFWNGAMMAHRNLIDAASGKLVQAKVTDHGSETIDAGGHKIRAIHYTYAASLPRDVWYDASGRWVKMRAVGIDGSFAEWVLK